MTERVTLITGASAGIGAELAKRYQEAACDEQRNEHDERGDAERMLDESSRRNLQEAAARNVVERSVGVEIGARQLGGGGTRAHGRP